MIVWDIHAGLGVTVLDPHGRLIEEVLDAIPRSRANDVIYVCPQEATSISGLNVLEPVARRGKPLIVSAVIRDLSKGALGEDVRSLLGSLIVTKLSLASHA